LIEAGHDIWYEPTLLVYHHRRPTFRGHFKQIGGYGLHRGHFAKIFPQTSAMPLYFAPSIFLLGNIILFFLGYANTLFWQIWGVLLAVYLILAIIDIVCRTRDISIAGMTLLILVGSHLVYGWRFIQGYFTSKLVSKLR